MIYTPFKEKLLVDALGGVTPIKVALLKSTYTPNKNHELWSDVSAHEITATGYTAGGSNLPNKAIVTTSDIIKLTGDNITWNITGPLAFQHVVFYLDGATKYLLSVSSFIKERATMNKPVTIEIPSNGVFALYNG